MQKQKRGFWLFIFSLIPGAGEMYMGFKKQGISIMFLFWGVFAIGACTGMDWLVFLIPIIWFYSFFNVHNLKSLSEEEFYSIEDSYVLHMDELAGDISSLLKHHGKITAILLIFLGASILWNTLVDFLYMILPGYLADVIGRFTYHLPQLVIAAAIIFTGIYDSSYYILFPASLSTGDFPGGISPKRQTLYRAKKSIRRPLRMLFSYTITRTGWPPRPRRCPARWGSPRPRPVPGPSDAPGTAPGPHPAPFPWVRLPGCGQTPPAAPRR